MTASECEPAYGQYIVPSVEKEINFKVGQPSSELLPLEKIRRASEAKFSEQDPEFLQYGNIYGYPKFRETLAKFLTKRYGQEVNPNELLATNGNTGGLSLVCSIFTKAGDLVFAEEPTYFLAKRIFDDFKLRCQQIPMDENGLDIYALEEKLKAGEVPVMMYVVPTAHNPTGRTLTAERREKLAALSSKYGFLLVCDEVYQMLTFPNTAPPPPMFTYNNGKILGLGSFSKILAPALRVGWIQGSKSLLAQIADCGQLDSSGGLNPVAFGIVQSSIDLGFQDEHVDYVREQLWSRYSALATALDENLPEGSSYEVPQGGYFILVRLPEGEVASELLEISIKDHRVSFLPGSSFADKMKNYLRLSFSYYSVPDLQEGAKRLGNAIRAYGNRQK